MPQNRPVSGGYGERDFRQCRIQTLDRDDGVFLLVEAKGKEKPVNFDIGVRWPDSDVVPVLVSDTGTFDIELDVYAVPVVCGLEEFADLSEGRGVRVLLIVDPFGLVERTG